MKKRNLAPPKMIWIFVPFLILLPFSLKAGEIRSFFKHAAILTRNGNSRIAARILPGQHAATINAQNATEANNRKWPENSLRAVTSENPMKRDVALRSFAAANAIAACRPISNGSSASVDFQLADGLIYMQASLNGSQPLWMMLDTGSSVTVFDESVSNSLGLRLLGEGNAYGPGQGSAQKLTFASHATLRFADTELDDQTVATLPLEWFSREVGRSTDGFLGSNIFRNYVVEIDYTNQVLRLHDPAAYSYSGPGQRLPLQFMWDNIPSVRADVVAQDGTPISGIFLIDSGATTAIWLTKAFSDAHPEVLSAQETVEVPNVVAVGGELSARLGRVPAIRLGGFLVSRPLTQFSLNTSGILAATDLAGIIGAQMLQRFTIIFDYPHREMILDPNERFGDLSE